jgi:hypothetical protein
MTHTRKCGVSKLVCVGVLASGSFDTPSTKQDATTGHLSATPQARMAAVRWPPIERHMSGFDKVCVTCNAPSTREENCAETGPLTLPRRTCGVAPHGPPQLAIGKGRY